MRTDNAPDRSCVKFVLFEIDSRINSAPKRCNIFWQFFFISISIFREIMSLETKKVLLMGMSAAGKTSMKSVIFSNCPPEDTKKLEQTVDVHTENVDFLDLKLGLWDCGGQTLYTGGYVDGRRPLLFRDVNVMVYVFDAVNLDQELDRDYFFYLECLEALRKHSPGAKVFCLVHKMDLVRRAKRHAVFERRQAQLLKMSQPTECRCYRTSIYENSLSLAWSSIVCELVPNKIMEMERADEPDRVLQNDES